MDYKFGFALAGIAASIAQLLPYIRDILRGKTRPHAFSWFVWGLPCGIIFAAQLVKGAGPGAWTTGITSLLCTIIFILSLHYGEKDIKFVDWVCLAFASIAVALWAITKDPVGSVVLITLSDVLGFVPTLRKSINKPYDETMSAYTIAGFKWIFSLLALNAYSFTICLYPLAMIVSNWLLVILLMVRRSVLTASK
ncbi:MAG: hypothetical protein P4M12_08895 [Gammaproteobacteria bacterium]|nr:hypothetical protein [Gammaproteobacteria bacterium]